MTTAHQAWSAATAAMASTERVAMADPPEIPVSGDMVRRLVALYQAGYPPESAVMHEQTAALGWDDGARLDRLFTRWPLSVVALPDGTRLVWPDFEARVDWQKVCPVCIDGIVIAPRCHRLDWSCGGLAP